MEAICEVKLIGEKINMEGILGFLVSYHRIGRSDYFPILLDKWESNM